MAFVCSALLSPSPGTAELWLKPFLSSQRAFVCVPVCMGWSFIPPAPHVAFALPPGSLPQHIPADRTTGTVRGAQQGFTREREQVGQHREKPILDGEQSLGKLDVRAEVTALAAQQVFLQRTDSTCSSALGTSLGNLLKLVTKCVWVCVTVVTATCQSCYRTNQLVLLQKCSTAQPRMPKAAARPSEVPDTSDSHRCCLCPPGSLRYRLSWDLGLQTGFAGSLPQAQGSGWFSWSLGVGHNFICKLQCYCENSYIQFIEEETKNEDKSFPVQYCLTWSRLILCFADLILCASKVKVLFQNIYSQTHLEKKPNPTKPKRDP